MICSGRCHALPNVLFCARIELTFSALYRSRLTVSRIRARCSSLPIRTSTWLTRSPNCIPGLMRPTVTFAAPPERGRPSVDDDVTAILESAEALSAVLHWQALEQGAQRGPGSRGTARP